MWMVVLCGAVIWLKWNCFGLWPLERLQQKRASRTSAHIYCHPLYHRIDLVLVSGIGLRIASLSAFLKTSTIFPFCFCQWHFSFPIIFVISSVRCIARIRLSLCSIVCYVVTECVRTSTTQRVWFLFFFSSFFSNSHSPSSSSSSSFSFSFTSLARIWTASRCMIYGTVHKP